MKDYILIILFIITFNTFCFSQENNLSKEKIVFIDQCSDKIMQANYKVDKYEYRGRIVEYSVNRGKWITKGILLTGTKIDTIKISKIELFVANKKSNKPRAYLNCDKLCNGIEKDYYSNGIIRLEGNFDNGIPIEIKLFERSGKVISLTTYHTNSFIPKKVSTFDIDSKLENYLIYELKETKIIIKKYDKNHKLIDTETDSTKNYQ